MSYTRSSILGCLLATICFFSFHFLNAQTPQWQWAQSYGGNKADGGAQVVCDPSGNVYSYGSFSSSSILIGTTTLANPLPTAANNAAYYLVKHDAQGNVLWVKSYPLQMNAISTIAVDAQGNLYMMGRFSSTLTLGAFSITAPPASNLPFIAKYSPAGNLIWLKRKSAYLPSTQSLSWLGTFTRWDQTHFVTYGNSINDTIDGQYIRGAQWLAKMDTAGVFSSFVQLDSLALYASAYTGGLNFSGMAVDQARNVYVSGNYNPHSSWNPATFHLDTVAGDGNSEIFVAKFDANLNFIWSKLSYCSQQYGPGYGHVYSLGLNMDAQDRLYQIGSFQCDTFSLDATHGHAFPPSSIATAAGNMLIRYTTMGAIVWDSIFRVIPPFTAEIRNLRTDKTGAVYFSGSFSGILGYNGLTVNASGTNNVYVTKFDADGRAQWLQTNSLGGKCGVWMDEDGKGNLYLTGTFTQGNTAFGGTTLTMTPTAPGYPYAGDAYITRLGNCNPTPPTLSPGTAQHLCGNDSITLYASPADHYLWSTASTSSSLTVHTAGTYSVYGISNLGCYAASVPVTVTSGTVNNGVTPAAGMLTANASGAVYQWVNCQSAYQPVLTATAQAFQPAQSGSYALVITQNGCRDTSACYTVTVQTTDVASLSQASTSVRVFPNPGDGHFTILNGMEQGTLSVIDVLGKVRVSATIRQGQTTYDWSALADGVYLIVLSAKDKTSMQRIVIQR